jgi:hypothetical protein
MCSKDDTVIYYKSELFSQGYQRLSLSQVRVVEQQSFADL